MSLAQTFSLIHAQIIRVISSPSRSITGFATLIRLVEDTSKQHTWSTDFQQQNTTIQYTFLVYF